jgi:hypothetical protein
MSGGIQISLLSDWRRPKISSVMNDTFSPIESEFSSAEESQAYDQWFREQIANSLTDSGPNIAHDVVMAEVQSMIEAKHPQNAG